MSTKANVGVIGKVREYHNELDSTNLYLQQEISYRAIPEGFAVIAHHQRAGKGQQSNKWHASTHKNVLFSFVLRPNFLDASRTFDLNRFVSLALVDMLSQHLPERRIQVKWPNDVYIEKKKIAGILIQNALRGHAIASTIIGIGLNVKEVNFPEEVVATSMMLEGSNVDVFNALEDLMTSLNRYYYLLQEGPSQLEETYQAVLYQKNEWCKYEIKGKKTSGKILGVDAQGALLLETIEGEYHQFRHGEISFL